MTLKLTYFITACAVAATLFFISSAPKAFTVDNSGGNQSLMCANCHLGGGTPGTLTVTGIPDPYTPGQSYAGNICLTDATKIAGGFSMAESPSMNTFDYRPGAFTPGSDGDSQNLGTTHIGHNSPKGFNSNTACWNFTWTAPAAGAGERLIQSAGNAVNLAQGSGGDNGGYQTLFTVEEGVLPVDLIKFNAAVKTDKVLLEWQTASEIDNDYFSIERSFDLRSYTEIAKIDGEGTTEQTQNYSFTDTDAPVGRPVFYRLKQVDFDGAFEYSLIEKVSIEQTNARINKVYPNPVFRSEKVKMDVDILNPSQSAQLVVSDMVGHEKIRRTVDVTAGLNTLAFSVNDLVAGNYFVTLVVDNQSVESQMFIVAQ